MENFKEMSLEELREERRRELERILSENVWVYDPDAFSLTYFIDGNPDGPSYDVGLDRMPDAAAVLDWIAQVRQKTWATPRVIGDLVILLDEVLGIQGNYSGPSVRYGKPPGPLPPLP